MAVQLKLSCLMAKATARAGAAGTVIIGVGAKDGGAGTGSAVSGTGVDAVGTIVSAGVIDAAGIAGVLASSPPPHATRRIAIQQGATIWRKHKYSWQGIKIRSLK